MASTDEELVARSRGGDLDSFNQLVLRWERPIYALAYRVIGREEDARDVAQETFLRAFRALSGFKGQAKFSSWLYRITLNLCRDWIRRERRTPIAQAPEGVDLVELASEAEPAESIENLVARRELGRAVAKAMAMLPDDQRTAIVLKEYHGLTFQEIADLLDCPLSTVKTRLYQGLTVLRKQLAQAGVESIFGGAHQRCVIRNSSSATSTKSSATASAWSSSVTSRTAPSAGRSWRSCAARDICSRAGRRRSPSSTSTSSVEPRRQPRRRDASRSCRSGRSAPPRRCCLPRGSRRWRISRFATGPTAWSCARDGCTGPAAAGSPSEAPAGNAAQAAPVSASSEQLQRNVELLAARLRDLEQAQAAQLARAASPARAAITAPELRRILAELESRQRTEMALQVSQVWKDFNAARVTDYTRLQDVVSRAQGVTNQQLRQHRDSIESLYRTASQR